MQGLQTDLDWSRTSQQWCLLLNYVSPGVLGKAYCLFNLNAFFSSHLFCWSNTLRCTTAQTLLLTARNKRTVLFISVCPFSLWRTSERLQNVLFQVGKLLSGTFGHLFEQFLVFPKHKFSLFYFKFGWHVIWNTLTFCLNNTFQSFTLSMKQWKSSQTAIKWKFLHSLFWLRYGFIGFDGCDTINCLIF